MAIGAGGDFYGLTENFENSEEIFKCSENDLILAGIPETLFGKLINRDLTMSDRIAGFCERYGIKIYVYGRPGYPERLKNIPNPPYLLYVLGNLPDMSRRHSIGMVGTRRMSSYGMENTYKISYELASAGLVTVSGLAKGIDGVAACGTLEAGGLNVAVIGTGLDTAYPAEHRNLMKEIARTGAVVSEFAPGSPPAAQHFPMRNRIISGLSDALFVAEADKKSGAMLTAADAQKQGRKIFALPGRLGDSNSEGPNSLIRDGHSAVTCSGDILEWFEGSFPGCINEDAFARSCGSSSFNMQALYCRGVSPAEDAFAACGTEDTDMPKFEFLSSKYYKEKGSKKKNSKKGNPEGQESDTPDPEDTLIPEDPELRDFYLKMPEGEAVNPDYFTDSGIGVPEAIGMLTLLEIGGFIRSLPGGLYRRQ